MKNLFVPYEIAVLAKEKGFNDPCLQFFKDIDGKIYLSDNDSIPGCNSIEIEINAPFYNFDGFPLYDTKLVSAPLYQQIIDWFREKHKIEVFARPYLSSQNITKYFPCAIRKIKDEYGIKWEDDIFYNKPKTYSYYQSLNKAIKEALKLI